MSSQKLFGLLAALLAVGLIAASHASPRPIVQDDDEPKYTTPQVMKLAHKDGLLKRVATGKASDEEKQNLIKLYKALSKNAPVRGDQESWKEKTRLLVEAATAAVNGEEEASEKLLKASNCTTCHKLHK